MYTGHISTVQAQGHCPTEFTVNITTAGDSISVKKVQELGQPSMPPPGPSRSPSLPLQVPGDKGVCSNTVRESMLPPHAKYTANSMCKHSPALHPEGGQSPQHRGTQEKGRRHR